MVTVTVVVAGAPKHCLQSVGRPLGGIVGGRLPGAASRFPHMAVLLSLQVGVVVDVVVLVHIRVS